MAEIINLRNVRKHIARASKQEKAAENRALFGKTKSERKKSEAEALIAAAKLDGHKRDHDR